MPEAAYIAYGLTKSKYFIVYARAYHSHLIPVIIPKIREEKKQAKTDEHIKNLKNSLNKK